MRDALPLRRWAAIAYKPQPWQTHKLHRRTEPTITLTTARQVGKSFAAGALIDERISLPPDDFGPRHVAVLGPTYQKARMSVEKYLEFILPTYGRDFVQTNLQEHRLWIPSTGARLNWLSADDPKSVVGFTFSDAITDESQDIPDLVMGKFTPTLGIRNAPLWNFGTPDITPDQTWFKANYIRGQDEGYSDNFSATVECYECEFWSPERILQEKMTMSEREFRMLMLGQWVDEEGQVFGGFQKAIMPGALDPNPQPTPYTQYAIGLDLAVYEDFTVLIVGERNTRICRAIYRWNSTDPFETYDRVEDLANHWNRAVVVADESGLGIPMVRELRERLGSGRVYGQKITSANKMEMVGMLNADMEHRRIMFPEWPSLIRELKAYVYHATPAGKLTAEAASGYHDDTIMALIMLNLAFHRRTGNGSSGYNWLETTARRFSGSSRMYTD